MKNSSWDIFFKDKVKKILTEKKSVIDIGGGLRIQKDKNNRYEKNREWMLPFLKNIDYKILDPVPDYHPDIVGDIHNLPFGDNSQEAIFCLAVLEHVENPIKAFKEMYRVLKPGGYCLVYVPFLYYYHAEKGYYGDYWRFTEDSLKYLSKPFSHYELNSVRGAIETWVKLSPLGRMRLVQAFGGWLDKITGKSKSKQVSGYNLFLIK
ncbi:class I SAM-dependent methyltransferase [Candidatus Parcubacteria bacterium]|nr:class I SAM-dependent methyltransferase [Candidatus Parcubacteria bacterium]